MIHLEDEIAMRSGLGLALEVLPGKRGQVNRLHGMKEEERSIPVLRSVLLEESNLLPQVAID